MVAAVIAALAGLLRGSSALLRGGLMLIATIGGGSGGRNLLVLTLGLRGLRRNNDVSARSGRDSLGLGKSRASGAGGASRAAAGRASRAGEIVAGGRVDVGSNDTKVRAGGVGGVAQEVPPDVGLAKERATNVLPEGLSIVGGGDGVAEVLAADGPACFRDPDGLVADGITSTLQGTIEEGLAVANVVVLGVLEVGKGVEADEVTGLGDNRVGSVKPSSAGIDVTRVIWLA